MILDWIRRPGTIFGHTMMLVIGVIVTVAAVNAALILFRPPPRNAPVNAYEVARRRLVVTDLPASSKTPNVHDGYNAAHKAQVGKLLDELKTLFVQEFSLNYPPPAAPVPPPTPPTP